MKTRLYLKSLFWLLAMLLATGTVQAGLKGKPAPDFTLPAVNKDMNISLSALKGKVIYLDFWASWCTPCRASFPLLNELYHSYKDQGLEIIAVNLDENPQSLENFMKLIPVDFTIVADKSNKVPEDYQVQAMPSSYIIDKKGVIRVVHRGFKKSDIKEIEASIQQLLAQ